MVNAKKEIINFISTNKFNYIAVSLIFFFVWVDVVEDGDFYFIADFFHLALLLIAGLFLPFILLIAILQNQSRIAYSITLIIFVKAILTNFRSLPFYIQEHYLSIEGLSNCSCCPSCEIKSILIINFISFLAIFLMNRKSMLGVLNWNIKYSFILIVLVSVIFLLNNILF
ncbi:MAG: hypothetical protein AB8F94_00765 [Saprospiraceae bacterium]